MTMSGLCRSSVGGWGWRNDADTEADDREMERTTLPSIFDSSIGQNTLSDV